MSEGAAPGAVGSEGFTREGFTLEVGGLRKSYPTATGPLEVLSGVDLALAPGTMTALLGVSGAGKSTLLHCIGTLDRPDAGVVRLAGRDVFAFAPAELARFRSRTLGFVFQFHHLLPEFTALENVMMPGWLARRPDSEVKADAVARALVNRPRLVLADEPSGNLDRGHADQLHALLSDVARSGPAVLVATHNERLAALAGTVLILDAGRTYRREAVPGGP